jgi:signal transduction histidine kinase
MLRRGARVLVIGDPVAHDEVVRLLPPRWTIDVVAELAGALASVRARTPDIVLVRSADSPGTVVDALRHGSAATPVPILYVSDDPSDTAREAALEAGADDVLRAPLTAHELVARVTTQLELASLRTDAATLQRISTVLAAELDMTRLLQLICDEATRLVGAELGALYYNLVDPSDDSFTQCTLSGVVRAAFTTFPLPRMTSPFAPAFRGEGILRLDDITQDPRLEDEATFDGPPPHPMQIRSYLAAPVVSRSGEVFGGLFFGHSQPAMFAERSERILEAIAAQGAIAIDNARLYDRVRDHAERERTARRAAEEANRAKDEFLAVLGHELRNPLAPIQTALQLIALRGEMHERERDVLERQVAHLIRLVDDLLDVSRITRGKIDLTRHRMELGVVVVEAIEMASPLIEQRRHRLVVDVPRTGHLVDVDPGRMAQVVSNLLTNAAKYTPEGGEIEVTCRREGRDVVLRIRDSGIGIAPETLSHVFEPFVQAEQALDRARGGLGLGLTIVRNFVEAHGGSVHAESAGVDQGSTFTVRLPAAKGRLPTEDSMVTQRMAALKANARRVLVVDDNVDAADLVVATLSALGHHAEAAHDGPSALGLASRLKPHIALLDIGLPVMDGYELARRLRELPDLSGMRLIALTGYGSDSDRDRSREAGFDAHLVKPLKLEGLELVLQDPSS